MSLNKNSTAIQRIVEVLKAKRVELGLNQKQVAEELGLSQTYMSQLENGNKPRFSTAILVRYADTLGVPLPIVIWQALTEDDVHPEKKEVFNVLKPQLDKMVKEFYK